MIFGIVGSVLWANAEHAARIAGASRAMRSLMAHTLCRIGTGRGLRGVWVGGAILRNPTIGPTLPCGPLSQLVGDVDRRAGVRGYQRVAFDDQLKRIEQERETEG